MRKAVRTTIGALAALLAALVVGGLMLPGRYRVQRTAVIAARPAEIFALVGDLRAWPRWGVWFQRDPAMTVAYSPSTSGVGAWSEWKSKSQGDGRMTVTAVRPPAFFEYRIEFPGMGMAATGTLELSAGAGGTAVRMTMEGGVGRNPANRWFALFMDRMVGPDFEAGLANLKKIGEAGPP